MPPCIFAGANFTSLFGPDPSHHARASAVPPTPLAHLFFFSGPASLSLLLPFFTSPPLPTPAPSSFLLVFRLQRFHSPGTELLHTQPFLLPSSTSAEKDRVLPVLFIHQPPPVLRTSLNQPCTSQTLETNLSDQALNP